MICQLVLIRNNSLTGSFVDCYLFRRHVFNRFQGHLVDEEHVCKHTTRTTSHQHHRYLYCKQAESAVRQVGLEFVIREAFGLEALYFNLSLHLIFDFCLHRTFSIFYPVICICSSCLCHRQYQCRLIGDTFQFELK